MPFVQSGFSRVSSTKNGDSTTSWAYKSAVDDEETIIITANYFNALRGVMREGDLISIRGTGNTTIYQVVTSAFPNMIVGPVITTSSLTDKSITSEKIVPIVSPGIGIPYLSVVDITGGATQLVQITAPQNLSVIRMWINLDANGTSGDLVRIFNSFSTTNIFPFVSISAATSGQVVPNGPRFDGPAEIDAGNSFTVEAFQGTTLPPLHIHILCRPRP